MASLLEINEEDVCSPIKNLEELSTFSVPVWTNLIVPLRESKFCTDASKARCHEKLDEWKPNIRYFRNTVPRTLVCHDMQGGYLEDRYVHGSTKDTAYNFFHWCVTDIFVYFSHNFITIPPLGWINAAHRHGVSILGTIITEGDIGKALINRIVEKDDTRRAFVNHILNITVNFQLDGWLLNIENELNEHDVNGLKKLLTLLTNDLHQQNPKACVIWYDSVIETGQLQWQNELNDLNKCWFDICDGIFLNYTWKDENLINTFNKCEHRLLDVFVGIDIFGRNCIGGMDCDKPLNTIRQYGFSVALFAPGWTHETLPIEPKATLRRRFEARDLEFWKNLSNCLYEHDVYDKPFGTTFHNGISKGYFNLNSQDLPINSLLLGTPSVQKDDIQIQECNCLTIIDNGLKANSTALKVSTLNLSDDNYVHRIVNCQIVCDNILLICLIYQYLDNPTNVDLFVLLQQANGRIKKTNLNELEYNPDNNEKVAILRKAFDLNFKTMDKKWIIQCYKIQELESKLLEIAVHLEGATEILIGGLIIQNYPIKRVH